MSRRKPHKSTSPDFPEPCQSRWRILEVRAVRQVNPWETLSTTFLKLPGAAAKQSLLFLYSHQTCDISNPAVGGSHEWLHEVDAAAALTVTFHSQSRIRGQGLDFPTRVSDNSVTA